MASSKVQWRNPGSVSLIGWKQCCIHWLHAGWTGKGSHQPVIYTVQVVDVHARQKSDRVPINKVHHTNDTSGETKIVNTFKLLLPYHVGRKSSVRSTGYVYVKQALTTCRYSKNFLVTSVLAPPSTASLGVLFAQRAHDCSVSRRQEACRHGGDSSADCVKLVMGKGSHTGEEEAAWNYFPMKRG